MLHSLEKDNIALRRKNEELEETLRQYTVRIKGMTPYIPQLKLTTQQGRLLWYLYTSSSGFRPYETIGPFIQSARGECSSPFWINTVVFAVRKKVRPFGIKIETVNRMGYSMPKQSREIIKEMILSLELEI
jgi:hypothetical protein